MGFLPECTLPNREQVGNLMMARQVWLHNNVAEGEQSLCFVQFKWVGKESE